MNDIDQRCDAYLSWLDAQRRDRTPVLAQIAASGAATSGIMGIAGAGTRALSIVATAFGLAGATYTNWNSRLLLDVDHSTVQAVVYRRQEQYRKDNAGQLRNASDRPAAIYLLRSYLRICMPITIEADINNTVTLARSGAPQSVIQAPLVRPVAVTGIIEEVSKPLPPPRRFVNPAPTTKLTRHEEGLTDAKIRQIETALCLSSPTSDLGPLNSPARQAMSEFFVGAGLGPTQTINDLRMLNKLQSAINDVLHGGTCSENGFSSPGAVGEAVKALSKQHTK
jgi:hypothetical protein